MLIKSKLYEIQKFWKLFWNPLKMYYLNIISKIRVAKNLTFSFWSSSDVSGQTWQHAFTTHRAGAQVNTFVFVYTHKYMKFCHDLLEVTYHILCFLIYTLIYSCIRRYMYNVHVESTHYLWLLTISKPTILSFYKGGLVAVLTATVFLLVLWF